MSIRRTLESSAVRLTGAHFASHVDERGEADDWRFMWLQKNNHSGADAEEFGGPWQKFTKVGFPIEYYGRLRAGARAHISPAGVGGGGGSGGGAGGDGDCDVLEPPPKPWASQFINHFPGSEAMDNKATMAACVREADREHPGLFATGCVRACVVPSVSANTNPFFFVDLVD